MVARTKKKKKRKVTNTCYLQKKKKKKINAIRSNMFRWRRKRKSQRRCKSTKVRAWRAIRRQVGDGYESFESSKKKKQHVEAMAKNER